MNKEREGVVFGCMTHEEQMELRHAEDCGKVIQFMNWCGVWVTLGELDKAYWAYGTAYRVKEEAN